MKNPTNDLAWCAFIIENDYLQISNSISTPYSINLSKQST